MRVLTLEVKAPVFSIKHMDTYQVAVSYLFIPPHTIVGAVGKALALMGVCRTEEDCLNRARDSVEKAREAIVNDASKWSVVLKRNRGVLEKKREKKRRDKSAVEEEPKSLDEIRGYSDALLREYVFSDVRRILIIPKGGFELEKALWLLERFGDSESLITVVEVKSQTAEMCNADEVNVVVKHSVVKSGNYVIYPALDESGKRGEFAAPMVRAEGNVYKPGRVKINGGVMCAGDVRFPATDEW